MLNINNSDAFVVAWLPGTEGGGVADVLVADSKGKPRYDFTGRLSFDWPAAELNAANHELPVEATLLKKRSGHESTVLLNWLLTTSMKSQCSIRPRWKTLYLAAARVPPWNTYVGDGGNWQKAGQRQADRSSDYGKLIVTYG